MKTLFVNIVLAVSGATALLTPQFEPLKNANHIFNAVHDSMRQFGSSLHHNGMSFFLASVTEGIQLYHGNASPDYLKEIGWMAFEPEHAMVFARPPRRQEKEEKGEIQGNDNQQEPLSSDSESAPSEVSHGNASGYLHTYTTTKPLRLLYVDGTSAGKSQIGTLDSQDRILFNETINGGVSMEDERARSVCRIAENEWEGRLDGVIRMAAGFEIILCKPEVNLAPVRLKQKDDNQKPRGKPASLLRATTSRFNDIGGDRVVVNYNNFVTAYSYDLDVFSNENGTEKGPRLQHIPSSDLDPIRQDLNTLVLEHDVSDNEPNWQAVADLIVAKYAPVLRGLIPHKHNGKPDSKRHQLEDRGSSKLRIAEVLAPFASPSTDESLTLCATQFLSAPDANGNSTLAHRAIYTISQTICSTLLNLKDETDREVIHTSVSELMKYLDWTTWKECRGCKDDEFCAVPIWPNGSESDFEHPRCERFEDGWEGRGGYWGGVFGIDFVGVRVPPRPARKPPLIQEGTAEPQALHNFLHNGTHLKI
ncbi:hypothetical protein BDV06DRAFT_234163 [Aspergillus oleicola]